MIRSFATHRLHAFYLFIALLFAGVAAFETGATESQAGPAPAPSVDVSPSVVD